MRQLLTLFLALFAQYVAVAELPSSFNNEVKKKLQWELKGLENDVLQLDLNIRNLKEDKVEIEQSLVNMRDWGLAQQQEKLEYYGNAVKLNDQLASANSKIMEQYKEQEELQRKYHFAKTLLSYVAGFTALLAYLKFGFSIIPNIGGPYSLLLQAASPAVAFFAGFFLIKLLF